MESELTRRAAACEPSGKSSWQPEDWLREIGGIKAKVSKELGREIDPDEYGQRAVCFLCIMKCCAI